MAIKLALRSMGAIAFLGLVTGPAFAGGPGTAHTVVGQCSGIGNCDSGVAFMPAPRGHSGPMTIENRTPYDFLDSVHFQRSPHVSITRIHSLSASVGLSDAPAGFTTGCHPQSTVYCRTGHQTVTPAPVVPRAAVPHPTVPHPYAHKPVAHRPVVQHPVAPPRIVAIGGGYDPSKFTPRVYGDPYTITPGIAYLPTSIIVRDPRQAQAVLDTGQARPNPWTPGGITPAYLGVPVRPAVPNVRPPYINPRPPMVGGPVIYPRPPMVHSRPMPPVTCKRPLPAPPYVPLPHPTATPPCGSPHGYKSRY